MVPPLLSETNPGRLGDREIWLMDSTGEQPRKLYETEKTVRLGNSIGLPMDNGQSTETIDEAG